MIQFENISFWDSEKDYICRRIAAKPAILKILLKTKNDSILLERWLVHHINIAGPQNVIVFDNMSDDPAVLAIYQRFEREIQLIRYSGLHNTVHDVDAFQPLYAALSLCSQYFVFLDTDEFLILLDGKDRYYKDPRILDFLIERGSEDIFPGTWLYNINWNTSQFVAGDTTDTLVEGLAWGKPIVRSQNKLGGFINHNIQFDNLLLRKSCAVNFFVLHMAHLSPQQRIRSNVYKLAARNFIEPGETISAIANRDLSGITDSNIILYVTEIRDLLPIKDQPEWNTGDLRPGCLELKEGGIHYFSAQEGSLIHGYLEDPTDILEEAIKRFGEQQI